MRYYEKQLAKHAIQNLPTKTELWKTPLFTRNYILKKYIPIAVLGFILQKHYTTFLEVSHVTWHIF